MSECACRWRTHDKMNMVMIALICSVTLGSDSDMTDNVRDPSLPNYSIKAEPYLTGGLFTDPLIPKAGEATTITVRAACSNAAPESVDAEATIRNDRGIVVHHEKLKLQPTPLVEGEEPATPPRAEAAFTWQSPTNGMFQVQVALDPGNAVTEGDERDNAASLILPVTVAGNGRALHFPWYREFSEARWCTCITSTRKDKRYLERGVLPLKWDYGGMSWSYYDKERAQSDPEAELKNVYDTFYKKYTTDADICGLGIDEIGGYPGTWKFKASLASMQALVKARADKPGLFYAVWNGGGMRPELAAYCRFGADLLLLETYLWRGHPDALGTHDIFAAIESRVEPFMRETDMFQPAYGNECYTLIALDTSERPDRMSCGELEQVVRFIRKRFPEMRGIGWYTGGYGNYGLVRTEETDRHHDAIKRKADDLCFEYWVKPCVTLMQENLWLSENADGSNDLVLMVSNIGGMDATDVAIEFFADGASVGTRVIDVPAGEARHDCTVQVRQPVPLESGSHQFEARIARSPNATVLDPHRHTRTLSAAEIA